MPYVARQHRQIVFIFICIFAILGAVLLADALFDPTTTADRSAMGGIGITFTALAILTLAFLVFDV
jgi:hypothetical protein